MKKILLAKTLFTSLIALALFSQASAAQQTGTDPAPSTRAAIAYFVIAYAPGPQWKRGEPLGSQGLEAHGRYMRQLAQDGILILAGPLSTTEGGLVILAADSLDEATAIMTKDPAIIEGQFIGSVSAWHPIIDPKNMLSPGMNSSR